MLLLITLLLLAAFPDQSLGEEDSENTDEEEITGSGVPPKTQKEIIDKHNEIRRNVDPPARNMLKMVWDEATGERARKWVIQCRHELSPKGERNTSDLLCGEITFQANYINTWTEVIEFWLGKKSNFIYGGPLDLNKNIYPYTQLIWYNSYRVGCAATYCPNTKHPYFYVCQYCPAGNMEHKLATPYEVGKPCGDCPNNCEKKLCTNPCKYTDTNKSCKAMKEMFTCKNAAVKKDCPATCYCKKSII